MYTFHAKNLDIAPHEKSGNLFLDHNDLSENPGRVACFVDRDVVLDHGPARSSFHGCRFPILGGLLCHLACVEVAVVVVAHGLVAHGLVAVVVLDPNQVFGPRVEGLYHQWVVVEVAGPCIQGEVLEANVEGGANVEVANQDVDHHTTCPVVDHACREMQEEGPSLEVEARSQNLLEEAHLFCIFRSRLDAIQEEVVSGETSCYAGRTHANAISSSGILVGPLATAVVAVMVFASRDGAHESA